MTPRSTAFVLAIAAAFGAGNATAGDVTGPEVDIDTGTENFSYQTFPAVACRSGGRCLVVWTGREASGTSAFYGQWLGDDGLPSGERLLLERTAGAGSGTSAHLAMADDGTFVLGFRTDGAPGNNFVRWFAANGQPTTPRVRIRESGMVPQVAMDPAGDTVVVSMNRFCPPVYGADAMCEAAVYARRYTKSGVFRDWHPVRFSSSSIGLYRAVTWTPAVAMDPSGDFAVAWSEQTNLEGNGQRVMARVYDGATGYATGPAFVVDAFPDDLPRDVQVAAAAEGHFLATWTRIAGPTYARAFHGRTPVGARVVLDAGARPYWPRVAGTPADQFVVLTDRAYDRPETPGWDVAHELYAQRFDADGNAIGSLTAVGVASFGFQEWPGVAIDPSFRTTTAWNSDLDPNHYRVKAQRLTPP